jgi:hypothetical protein
MKDLHNKILSFLLVSSLFLSCSQKETPVAEKDKKGKAEQIQSQKEKTISLYPTILAGSLRIIQKIYFKKVD